MQSEERVVIRDAEAAILAYVCYALLRMRPLSISCAECSVVISCGKVDDEKSGYRGDGRQMWRLCMSDSRIQRRETRSR
jgi:hypothetical protein